MRTIVKIATSKLPTETGEFDIHIYQEIKTGLEHVALVKGDITHGQDVLTRVHSECMTGDIFGSQRCDCGEQLHLAQQRIQTEGTGVLIYLRGHEGRGIGLSNKIRAYALQDHGLDTVEANLALGLPVDQRSFAIAAEMLKCLKVSSIRLMSNNPDKNSSLQRHGVTVNAIVPLRIPANANSRKYLETKASKLGHLF
ncbi:GTP cyclohydrolase II [Methylobacillus flagellatus]|uniref:GTP cyclohydrolase II n=1 Tax=Methylobacillus flagellatus TaxID=405 RepID=UPI0010F912EF|nr:GTP cyclohydrolase II [Methylobacillus flagellatus]